MGSKKSFYFNVAEIVFEVKAGESNINLTIEKSFLDFVVKKPSKKSDIQIEVYNYLPDQFSNGEIIFKTSSAFNTAKELISDYCWEIRKMGEETAVTVCNLNKPDRITHIASFSDNYTKWKIYCNNSENNNEINPLQYPIGPIILYYSLLVNDGILLHASAVEMDNKGFVFAGFSGAGKTTMAELLYFSSIVIDDDRLAIRIIDDKFFVFSTPVHHLSKSRRTSLNEIYIIHHSKENSRTKISIIEAYRDILAFTIQHNYNPELINKMLQIVEKIVDHTSVFHLGFKPDSKIVTFLKG